MTDTDPQQPRAEAGADREPAQLQIREYEQAYNAFMLDMLDAFHAFAADLASAPLAVLDAPAAEDVRAQARELLDRVLEWHREHPFPQDAVWPPLPPTEFARDDASRATHALARLAEQEAIWEARLQRVVAGAEPRSLWQESAFQP